jgi:hypothetical protein
LAEVEPIGAPYASTPAAEQRDDTEPTDSAAPPQREYANGAIGEQPVPPRDEVVSDRDLERLEATLRSLQHEEADSAHDDTKPSDRTAPPQREYRTETTGEQPVPPRDEVVRRDLERLEARLRWFQLEESAKRIAHETRPPPAPFRPEAAAGYPDSDRVGFLSPPLLEPARPTPPAGELRPAGADKYDPLQSPYAPKHARLRSTSAPEGYSARSDTKPSNTAAPPQREYANAIIGEQPVPPGDETAGDCDLERIDATLLRWLQREEAAKRIAHETRPQPALLRRGAATRHPDSDRVGFRSPPSLEPARMPPPPRRARRDASSWLLPILIAAGSAGALGYYFSADGWGPAWTPVPLSQFASYLQGFHAPRPIGQERTGPIGSRDDESGTSMGPILFRQADVVPVGRPPAGETVELPPAAETVVLLPPKAIGAETPSPSKPVRVLDREEIELLLNQGEGFAAVGDLAAARTVFQRAAEAGSAKAAVALASTYDPAVLKKLGVVGIHADVEKAQSWYQKAESLGSAEATLRLQRLAKQ